MELHILIGVCAITTINARLIEKSTGRTLVTNTKTTAPQLPPRVRLTRDLSDEDTITGFSREYNGQSLEFLQSYNRRARDFYKPNPSALLLNKLARKPRESNEKVEKTTKSNVTITSKPVKNQVLIKKPIPKFHEMDYEDDFQIEVSKAPVKVADSGDHEDEDFNVGDYEFDVNHDEFVGRGRPLEPRAKHKVVAQKSRELPKSGVILPINIQPPEVKTKSKIVETRAVKSTTQTNRKVEMKNPNEKSKEEDYYDDTTTVKAPEVVKNETDSEEESYDGEESKEVEKKASARLVRSPLTEKIQRNGSVYVPGTAKVVGVLEMFPVIPNDYEDHTDEPAE